MAKTVVVVDDEKDIRGLIEKALGMKGYTMHAVGNGRELFELLKKVKADLILLDVMMPGSNGFEICQQLKSQPETASIPVMMITVLSPSHYQETSEAAGAQTFLSKPFDLDKLESEIEMLLEPAKPE